MKSTEHRGRVRRRWMAGAVGLGVAAGTLAVAAPSTALTPAEQYRSQFLDTSPDAPVLAVGHTGAWRDAPENSAAGIDLAIQQGVPIAEIDVRRTSDGELVLMHDETVDRTTDGTGRVDALTLDQLQQLRLRELRGGTNATLTDLTVPTLEEVFAQGADQILFNIDKAWDLREEVYAAAAAAGVVDQVIFKSDSSVAEVDAFRAAHPDALYCHVITDANEAVAHTFATEPNCYEVVWDAASDVQIQQSYVDGLNAVSRVFMNTMWRGLAGDFTDEGSLRDDASGWQGAIDAGADLIQTDDPAALLFWLAGNDIADYGLPSGAVRVQAEDFDAGGEGVGYHDNDATNQGGQYRPDEGVDICDLQGNIHVCWIRAGEWLSYTVSLPEDGDYRIRARVASPYASPTGTVSLEFADGSTSPIGIRNTTGHQYFLMQTLVESWPLSAGTQTILVRVDGTAFQNFNLDWIQFERV